MTDFLTVVLMLPEDTEQRKQITQALGFGSEFHGARVTAMALGDEISVVERLEDELSNDTVGRIRAEVESMPLPDWMNEPEVANADQSEPFL